VTISSIKKKMRLEHHDFAKALEFKTQPPDFMGEV